jgi:hypothetical protein
VAKAPLTGLRLFGVVTGIEGNGVPAAPNTSTVRCRELVAVVRQAPYVEVPATPEELAGYRGVVDAIFRSTTVLPAPFSAVFRSREHVSRWLDTHYIALIEALHFVDGRCEGRVHVRRHAAPPRELPEVEIAALAAEAFRMMRRQVVAALPIRQDDPATLLSAAFLMDQERFDEFVDFAKDYERRSEVLALDVTGPWPPYDFVRLELGSPG